MVEVSKATPFQLAEAAVDAGFHITTLELIGSTNDAAMELARAGRCDRMWFVAKEQTKGRGRHGRLWISPPGNLYTSLLLIDAAPAQYVSQLGFVAGVALARALRELCANDARLRLKWPNDILFDGAKLGGILIESVQVAERFVTIVGIGVNCASHPNDLPYTATALSRIGASCTPQDVFYLLSGEFAHWFALFAGGTSFEHIRDEWLRLAAGLGASIQVSMSAGEIAGRFETIDAMGRLVLKTEDGVLAVDAGDVVFGH